MATADRLVLISSFEGPLSEAMIGPLIAGIERDPHGALAKFDQLCGLESQARPDLNVEVLLEDLRQMLTSNLDLERLDSVPEIVIVAGSRDRVIPSVLSKRLHRRLSGSRLLVVKDSGHGLPFLHPETCWEVCR
jgi:pimeloyl-ACP methyl ester carboxylesterase